MKRLLLCASLLGLAFACNTAFAAKAAKPSVQVHGHTFSTEFALDDASREHGLMNRTVLAPDHSMLFVFGDSEPRYFWMKNTLIPLDILYFDKDRKLIHITADAAPCKADPCAVYPSYGSAQYVLELAGGVAAKSGLQVGDEMTIIGDISGVH
ncbi:DUF192 domain-containing protein [Dyella sp.]|uniref:DUF192 domain-containing protein n=1 Tax=Dyella sp. TaxID=1869338 RepID=UPI002ED3FAC1